MKKIVFLLLLLVISYGTIAQTVSFESSPSLYPEDEELAEEDIEWGYLSVPENWQDPQSETIRIATALLRNTSSDKAAKAVVHVPGGPGGSGVSSIWFWIDHPLRAEYDIVLFDVRGTGFSEPRLCPDLGDQILKILATNQSADQDERQKVEAAISCKDQLLKEGRDITAYHSTSVARDINALRKQLGYTNWHVYGVSYGTYMAQKYADDFPDECSSLILDSSVSDISQYYSGNTSGYMTSLNKLFELCKNDENCSAAYPNLEAIYYQVISDLDTNPITVDVDLPVLESGKFTYNVEDFKVTIQQALYEEMLIELVPLLIYEFHHRNTDVLSSLVAAFSGGLSLDYGVYYCVSCSEALPFNSFFEYQNDASKYQKLQGGIAFYKSDFKVCEAWNGTDTDSLNIAKDFETLRERSIPILILSGGFDPITPFKNGKELMEKYNGSHLANAPNLGHAPGFSSPGQQIVADFLAEPGDVPQIVTLKAEQEVQFVNDVNLNSGIIKLGESIGQPNFLFLSPLLVAIIIMLSFILAYLIKLFKRRRKLLNDRIIRALVLLSSIVGVGCFIALLMAIVEVANENFFILAFGLPASFNSIFVSISIFLILVLLSLIYLAFNFKKIQDRSILFTVIFSNMLLGAYLLYWNII